MSFTSAGDPRSAWPFGDPVATALLGLLEVELRERSLRWRVAAPERLEVFPDGAASQGRAMDVSALRARMADGAKADWPELVEQAVTGWLAQAEQAGQAERSKQATGVLAVEGESASSWSARVEQSAEAFAVDGGSSPSWAAPLRSRLLPSHLAAATYGALTRPALPGLTEVVLCETGEFGGGRLLAAEQAGTWSAHPGDVFAAARANVRRLGVLPPERLSVDGANVTLLSDQGPYCPTHVFWLEEYLRRDGFGTPENGALVVMPHRHLLAYHAIETTEAVAATGALLRLASRQFETAPGPLTDQIYWWRAERVSVLPVDSSNTELRVLPTPEFGALLGRLRPFCGWG